MIARPAADSFGEGKQHIHKDCTPRNMIPMSSLTRNLATGWSFVLAPIAPTPERESAFDKHIAVILARNGRFATSWAMIMVLLFWPTDLLAFHRLPAAIPAFAMLRAALLAACVVVLLGLRGRTEVPIGLQPFLFAPWPIACAALAYCLMSLGGLETPWFHFAYLCVTLTIFFPVRPANRILYAVVVAGALFAGGLAARPGILRSPFLPTTLGFLIFIVIGSVAFGQLLFLLTRSNFFQAHALQHSAAVLSERVAEQTQELRQLAAYQERILEAERGRISRELHDELGQELTALRYELRFARQRFEREPASIRANLETLELLLGRTVLSARTIVTDLKPRILDDMGLGAAAEWLVESTSKRTELPCTLNISGREPEDLAYEVAIAAFRIMQESLTNAARHAAASRVAVSLCFLPGELELTVQDDGIGIAAQQGRSGGMGLLGMRERAHALGGTFALEGGPGRGTTIRCSLPLTKAAAP